MVLNAYIPLLEMSLLVSCKTDRKQLRGIGSSSSTRELASLQMPSTGKANLQSDAEKSLQELRAKLLGDDVDFGRQDNFFDVGGDYLRVMKLVAAARAHGLVLRVAAIFPTLADVALTMEVPQMEELIHKLGRTVQFLCAGLKVPWTPTSSVKNLSTVLGRIALTLVV